MQILLIYRILLGAKYVLLQRNKTHGLVHLLHNLFLLFSKGICYNCISSCSECTDKFGYPACQKCTITKTINSGLSVKSSQSLSTYGCVYVINKFNI